MTPGEHRETAEKLLLETHAALAAAPRKMRAEQMRSMLDQCALLVEMAKVHVLLADSLERAS